MRRHPIPPDLLPVALDAVQRLGPRAAARELREQHGLVVGHPALVRLRQRHRAAVGADAAVTAARAVLGAEREAIEQLAQLNKASGFTGPTLQALASLARSLEWLAEIVSRRR